MSKSISLLFLVILIASCTVNKKPKNSVLLAPLTISTKSKKFQQNPDKEIDILHTVLNVSFDWEKHECLGYEEIIFTPYFYPIDSFRLDAKQFIFNQVSLLNKKDSIAIRYEYNDQQLVVFPASTLTSKDTFILRINYIAQPDKSTATGSSAISDAKGLYFVNTDNAEPFKPKQLWTQGETEANSNWFATIDKPFEKMTFDIHITVPDSMTTLSNGLLIKSKNNADRTRTDSWISDKPMSAYLVMMAIGNFKKTTTSWRNKEVSYYLEPAYHPFAENIFKHTPEMLEYFSNQLGVEYPWQKYAQVVVRDYVSGAMENTSATLHGDFVQKNERELLDKQNDGIIAHELFHQWFGDLVTCESWSHLTLNEGFATFGEQLWFGYKYGKERELKHIYSSMRSYLRYAKRNDGPLVQFYYDDKEDMFNPITYQKGSRIINLLKFTLGDEAFFKGLKNYLKTYSFTDAEVSNLRQSLEASSGKDLSYFFNQWFYRGGHPSITLESIKKDNALEVTIQQTQKDSLFSFPFQFRSGDSIYTINCFKQKTTITIPNEQNHSFIYPDPNGIFIGEIENLSLSDSLLISYFDASKNYIEKMRILDMIHEKEKTTLNEDALLLHALNDDNSDIVETALRYIKWTDKANLSVAKETLKQLATLPKTNEQQARAIMALSNTMDTNLISDYDTWAQSQSYTVSAAALSALKKVAPQNSLELAKKIEKDAAAELFNEIGNVYGDLADSSCKYFTKNIMRQFGSDRNSLITNFGNWAKRMPKENQDEYWNLVTERAKKDINPWTRYTAIISLNDFIKSTKDVERQNELTDIISKETDKGVRRQLINKKLITQNISKDE